MAKKKRSSSIFDKKMCKLYRGKTYELMLDNPWGHKYRVVLSRDDYDYVEDKKLIKALDKVFES